MVDRPKVGIGVIVLQENKILLGKRKNAYGEGCWREQELTVDGNFIIWRNNKPLKIKIVLRGILFIAVTNLFPTSTMNSVYAFGSIVFYHGERFFR